MGLDISPFCLTGSFKTRGKLSGIDRYGSVNFSKKSWDVTRLLILEHANTGLRKAFLA